MLGKPSIGVAKSFYKFVEFDYSKLVDEAFDTANGVYKYTNEDKEYLLGAIIPGRYSVFCFKGPIEV